MSTVQRDFTLDQLGWEAWTATVSPETATPEQRHELDANLINGKITPYYALLAQDPAALRERSPLFKAAMYAPRGLSRAERELASVITSRVNGCVYCASVHSRLYAQLSKSEQTIRRILDEGVDVELPPRERALADYTIKLTRTPKHISAADLVPLREQGFSELEILDLTHVVAMFAWANRLLQTLGEPVREEGL